MEWSRQPLVELTDICRNFNGKTVLHNLSFSMNKGDFVSVMGPSGSGKSTLINIVGLIDRFFEGNYIFFGKNVSKLKDKKMAQIRASEIGYVFQAYHLIGSSTVEDNILLQAYYAHKPVEKQYFCELTDKLGISELLKQKAAVLSGGEKQRVSIARALINRPALLIADEPTGNLDEENTAFVSDIFEDMHRNGTSVLMVTHDKRMASKAEKKYMLLDGKLVEA